MSEINDNSNNNNNNKNSIKKEEKKTENNKRTITTDKDNNSNIILNTSNDIDNNNYYEDINIKRTMISPDVSPDDIKLENNKNIDDNFSNNLASVEEANNLSNFNSEPFISPTMKKRNYKTISKMDKIIIEYNMIKYNINKILLSYQNQNKTKKEKYVKKLSECNISLLNHLSELSAILNKLVENQKIYTNKNLLSSSPDAKHRPKITFVNNSPTQGVENTEKMLNYYEKQYTKVSERLKIVKNAQYVNDLKTKINDMSEEILVLEKENRDLHKNQIIQGNLLKSVESGKSPELMENILIKKKEAFDKVQNEFIKTIKKTEKDKEQIKSNEEKINLLNEKCTNLTNMAKDLYNIEHFEPVEKIIKKSKEKKLKYERKKREFEVNIHSIKSNINKLKVMYEQNKKDLQYMENEKNALIEKYQRKLFDLDLCCKKLKDYQNINMNMKYEMNNKNENGKNSKNIGKYSSNDLKEYNHKRKKLNIIIDASNSSEKKQKNIYNYKNMNDEKLYNDIYENSINNRKKNSVPILSSSGPSLISLTKEKSNFADINDIQLLNTSNNDKNSNNNNNNNNNIKTNIPKIETKKKENIYTIKKEINKIFGKSEIDIDKDKDNNKDTNEINEDNTNTNNIKEQKDNKEEKNNKYISPIKLNMDGNKETTIDVLNKNGVKTLSKEMILKGLDEQEKKNNTLIYSSRITKNKGYFDRRNLLKLNFSFVSSNKKDNKLNMSLNTLPNERKFLNDEIEEDIMTDNSADNINIKESKMKKENDMKKNNLINNNSIEIGKNIIDKYQKKYSKESNEKENNIVEDIIENNNDNENKSQLENVDKNKRENALNTILYNVNENNQETKNDKFSQNNKTNNNTNENKDEEQVNKSFEEEHIFDKKNEKEEDDDVNYDFDDGDNIIDIDYDKI